jgi:hypothetical protein
MSRISRVNVDVTATTSGLESGMRRAEARVEGFAQRVEGMKGGLEKLRGVIGLGAGGFGVVGAISAVVRSIDSTVTSLADASERAAAAIQKLRTSGAPLSESGLTPTTAAALAAIAPQAKGFRQRGSVTALTDTFLGEAFVGRDAAKALGSAINGLRASAAFGGGVVNAALSDRGSQFAGLGAGSTIASERIAGRRLADDIALGMAEAMGTDDQAQTLAVGRAFLRTISDDTYRSLILGRGAR